MIYLWYGLTVRHLCKPGLVYTLENSGKLTGKISTSQETLDQSKGAFVWLIYYL